MFGKIKNAYLESPAWKTVCSVFSLIVAGILCGTFVTEITSKNGIEWLLFYKSKSFYGLIVLSILTYFDNKIRYLAEKEILRFRDAEYCVAYMRSKCLPEAAERYKELIRLGNVGELTKAMNELKDILK